MSSSSTGSSKLETTASIKEPSATMTNNGKHTSSTREELPTGKRVTTAASRSDNGDITPATSAKRLKRVSIESQDASNNDDSDATTALSSSSSSSKAWCSTSSVPRTSCCACQCHQQQATGCVPTTKSMVQSNVHHRQDTSSTVAVSSQKPSSKEDEEKNATAAAALVWEHVGYNSTITGGSHDDDVVSKRQDYISWDEYFMSVAALSSFRSKDPHQPAGCCLVDARHRIVGIGYNGFPAHCSDDCLPWSASSSSSSGDDKEVTITTEHEDKIWLHTKYPYVCHAEVNAILNKCSADIAERGARLYVLDFPCNECAKVIIQAGLSEVIYLRDQEPDSLSSRASRLMFLQARVKMRRHEPERICIDLEFGQFLDSTDDNGCSSASASTTSILTATTTTTMQQQQHRDLMLLEAKGYDPCKMSSGKRTDYISWDDYYMAVAFLTAQRSKDPNTQVGACIVMRQRIVGLGYNGFPAGCSDDHLPWARTTDPKNNNNNPLHTKYPYVCHAEMNAILNKCTSDIHGATLYVALFPCNECTKIIIQAGIREVVYMSDKYHDTDTCRASRIMLQMAGVKMRKYVPSKLSLSIHFGPKP